MTSQRKWAITTGIRVPTAAVEHLHSFLTLIKQNKTRQNLQVVTQTPGKNGSSFNWKVISSRSQRLPNLSDDKNHLDAEENDRFPGRTP